MPLPSLEISDTDARSVLRPIVALTECLATDVLEAIVVEAMLRYRQLRDAAEMRHVALPDSGMFDKAADPAYLAYIRAMIDLHGQQAVLSALVDALGYVPDMPIKQE